MEVCGAISESGVNPPASYRLGQVQDLLRIAADLCQVAGIPKESGLDVRIFKAAGKIEECRNEIRIIEDEIQKL